MKAVLVILWIIAIASSAVYLTAAEAQTWMIGPTTGQHTTVVDPYGNHHTIVDHRMHGGFYRQHPQPGFTQYPNPVDSGLQSFRRGAEWGQWFRSLRSE